MSYAITINFTDQDSDPANKGSFSLYPGETNNTVTSLTLMGQGSTNYGKHIFENFIKLLENFCSADEPYSPTRGQLWFDTNKKSLQVLSSISGETNNWSTVGGIVVSDTAPDDEFALWYDISDADPTNWQLKLFDSVAWISVAGNYVRKTGDTMTGDITFAVEGDGIRGTVNGFTGIITPTTTRGPIMFGEQHSTIVINGGSTVPTGSEFVVGKGMDVAAAVQSTGRLLTISDTGAVTVHQSNLSLNSNKIIALANGTQSTDAAAYGQLTSVRDNLQSQIDDLDELTVTQGNILNNKVSKTGDTMSGQLTINNSLVVSGATTLGSGLTVTGGNGSFSNTLAVGQNLTVSGNAAITGTMTVTSNSTLGGPAQLNSTLTVNGNTQLKSTTTITGAATLQNNLTVAGNTTLSGTTTMTGVATMNQPVSSIVNNRHVTTKEYVDQKVAGVNLPSVPTGLWAGTTTIQTIRATYTDPVAYPPGTSIVYTYLESKNVYWGNGTSVVVTEKRRTAVRTQSNGWMDVFLT